VRTAEDLISMDWKDHTVPRLKRHDLPSGPNRYKKTQRGIYS